MNNRGGEALTPTEQIRIRDCFLYLFGNRDAIQKVARCNKAIYLGAFFVFIAGICREYDQEYILQNFGLFFAPFLASFIICILIRLLCLFHFRKKLNPNGLGSFRAWLSLFWMTAPCAWVYAFPAEELFDSLTALKINFFILGLVIIWRVWLFSRVVKVLTGVNILWAILAFAAPVIAVVTVFTQLNIVGVMSGGQRTAEQELLLHVNGLFGATAFYATIPIWITFIWHLTTIKSFTSFEPVKPHTSNNPLITSCGLLFVCATALMVLYQPRLSRLIHFKALVDQAEYKQAIVYADRYEQNEFPATRKMYPPLHYYGFEDAMGLFSSMKGDEKAWLKNDVEKWIYRGLESNRIRYGEIIKPLQNCPMNDYHVDFLKRHKTMVEENLKHCDKELESIENKLKLLEIEITSKPVDAQ